MASTSPVTVEVPEREPERLEREASERQESVAPVEKPYVIKLMSGVPS